MRWINLRLKIIETLWKIIGATHERKKKPQNSNRESYVNVFKSMMKKTVCLLLLVPVSHIGGPNPL